MNFKEIEEFFTSASRYCYLVENLTSTNNEDKLKQLLLSLSTLYTNVLYLPNIKPKSANAVEIDFTLPKLELRKYDMYWNVYDPYEYEKPINGSLKDDLLDIYNDIKTGALLYYKHEQEEAVWHWKYSFEIHWGRHAINALRALHAITFK